MKVLLPLFMFFGCFSAYGQTGDISPEHAEKWSYVIVYNTQTPTNTVSITPNFTALVASLRDSSSLVEYPLDAQTLIRIPSFAVINAAGYVPYSTEYLIELPQITPPKN